MLIFRADFYAAQTGSDFEYFKLQDSAIDELLKSGRELVAANFVTDTTQDAD